jgi:hypothetical protein
MTPPSSTPEAITELIAEWKTEKKPEQKRISWNRERWQALDPRYPKIASHKTFIAGLPNRIGREDVRGYAAGAAKSPDRAVEAFIASMVWGFGSTGYGVYRTNRILTVNPDAPERLHSVAQILTSDGPVEGYRAMANEQRLKWLGPAFGTKYLYFCSADDNPALVLDALVAVWLNQHCGTNLRPWQWSTLQYEKYVTDMASWAGRTCTSVELETIVFTAEASSREGNQWGTKDSGKKQ